MGSDDDSIQKFDMLTEDVPLVHVHSDLQCFINKELTCTLWHKKRVGKYQTKYSVYADVSKNY